MQEKKRRVGGSVCKNRRVDLDNGWLISVFTAIKELYAYTFYGFVRKDETKVIVQSSKGGHIPYCDTEGVKLFKEIERRLKEIDEEISKFFEEK